MLLISAIADTDFGPRSSTHTTLLSALRNWGLRSRAPRAVNSAGQKATPIRGPFSLSSDGGQQGHLISSSCGRIARSARHGSSSGVTAQGLWESIDTQLNAFKKMAAPAGHRVWPRETQGPRPGRLVGGRRTCRATYGVKPAGVSVERV